MDINDVLTVGKVVLIAILVYNFIRLVLDVWKLAEHK